MNTKVIHINDVPVDWINNTDYVYIGRAGKQLPGFWGNPFPLTAEKDRSTVLQLYMKNLLDKINEGEIARNQIRMLRGRTLVCFCAPKLCHGDVLALLAEVL